MDRKTPQRGRRGRRRVLSATGLALGLVITQAVPAWAADGQQSGEGTYTINGRGVSGPPPATPCAIIEDFSYLGEYPDEIGHEMRAIDGTTVATYNGPIEITFNAVGDFYENPDGTFGTTDTTCTGTAGSDVPIENITITSTGSSGSVSCTFAEGTYWRNGSANDTTYVEAEGGTCDVTGSNGGPTVNDSPTDLTIVGNITGCSESPSEPFPPPESCTSEDRYYAS